METHRSFARRIFAIFLFRSPSHAGIFGRHPRRTRQRVFGGMQRTQNPFVPILLTGPYSWLGWNHPQHFKDEIALAAQSVASGGAGRGTWSGDTWRVTGARLQRLTPGH
jgi:hypothetical protein